MTQSHDSPVDPRHHARETAAGMLYILVTLVAWSSVPLFLKYFTGYVDGWTANGWRYGMSALFWLPTLLLAARKGLLPPHLWRAAIIPSAFNIVAQCCFAWAPYYIQPGMLTFLLRMQIVFVALGAYLLFPVERRALRTASYWLGVTIVMAGLLGLCFLGIQPPRGQTAFGVILGLVAGFFYAGYSLSVRYCMHGVPSLYAFASICLYTALGLVVMMLAAADHAGSVVWTFTALQFGMLVASALIGIALTHVLYYAAMARLGVSIAAGVILLQPFLTSFASYFLFDERLTPLQWLSGFAAMGGAVLLVSTQRREAVPREVAAPLAITSDAD